MVLILHDDATIVAIFGRLKGLFRKHIAAVTLLMMKNRWIFVRINTCFCLSVFKLKGRSCSMVLERLSGG